MVRFFGRIKTLEMHGTIAQSRGEGAAAGTAAGFTGDVNQLLDTMRQCPRYRLDEHHQRCAFRTRLLPCIEKIQRHTEPPAGALGVGICGHCWRQDDGGRRRAYSWRRPMPPPLRVSRSTLPDHCDPTGHYPVRDFFTGKDVVWLT